jgi:hypothetical protein
MASSANASKTTTTTSETRDNSVLFALGELARLESDRVAGEKARAEAREAELRRAAEREAAEREEAGRRAAEREAKVRAVAEAEARLKVEAEIAQDARMHALKAELARVQAEREQMHQSVLDASRPAVSPPPPTRAWALAFGLSSVVAAALAGLLVMQAYGAPRVVEVERQVVVTVPVPVPAAVETARAIEAAPLAQADIPVATPTRGSRRPPRADRTRPIPTTTVDDLDFRDDGDVIGGIEHDDTSMGRRTL